VYGIDMPTQTELIAHGRSMDEIRDYIGCDALIYQEVGGMKAAIAKLNPAIENFDASCFDGVYVTGDIAALDVQRINANRSSTEATDASRLALHNS
jgi:amidophosphoribosyltransferase